MYFYNARWYDGVLGRFVSPDSLVPQPYNPLDWDRYSYTRNNPIRYTDPTGHYVASTDEGSGKCRNSLDCVYWEGHEKAGEPVLPLTENEKKGYDQLFGHGLAMLPGFETGEDVLTVLTGCGYTCQLGSEGAVGPGGRAWAFIGLFAPVSGKTLRILNGQAHHVLSRRIMNALDSHAFLRGVLDRELLIVQAADMQAHKGYQTWHRAYDKEVVRWLSDFPRATPEQFLSYMRELYQRTEMDQRFPQAWQQLQMAIEEWQ